MKKHIKRLTVDKPEYLAVKCDDILFQAIEGQTNFMCAIEPFLVQTKILKTSVPVMLLIFLLAGTSTDVWMAVYLAITTAEQIRCSHTSQDHIIHSTENHCHSLTQSCRPSFFVSLSLAHTYLHLAHSPKR